MRIAKKEDCLEGQVRIARKVSISWKVRIARKVKIAMKVRMGRKLRIVRKLTTGLVSLRSVCCVNSKLV